jgi:N-acetylneuraminate synthase/N,N'-diacetyllegionaminate synthase
VPTSLEIGRRRIGPGEPLFVVAEIGSHLEGSLDRALILVDAAAAGGADAVTFQTAGKKQVGPTGSHLAPTGAEDRVPGSREQWALDEPALQAIAAKARSCGLAVIATPSSLPAIDMLERINVDAYKIASGDLTYHGLIDYCSRTRKPVLLSTGMATVSEIQQSIWSAARAGGRHTALLHCVSSHPVTRGSDNLRAISTLAGTFGLPVGLSDHAPSAAAVPIAISLGATLYTRHLRLEGDDDSLVNRRISSTPAELAEIVRVAAETAAALGHGRKECLHVEQDNLVSSRRSLRATRSLPAGHVVGADDIAVLRPGTGLPPECEADLIGVRLTRPVDDGAPFLACDLPTLRSDRAA